MDAAQVYETTILDRQSGRAFALATVPARSLPDSVVPPVKQVADRLELDGVNIAPVEAWSLPFLIDASLGRFPDFRPFERLRPERGPSEFAQYLAYAPVVPFESSPLAGKSLAEIITAVGGGTSASGVGALAAHDPMLLLTVPAGIIVYRAAWHIGDGIGIALRTLLLRLVGAEDTPPRDEEGQGREE